MSDYPDINTPGLQVISRDGRLEGETTGVTRICQLSGCTGRQLVVRWPNKRITYPCTKGMIWEGDRWRIE